MRKRFAEGSPIASTVITGDDFDELEHTFQAFLAPDTVKLHTPAPTGFFDISQLSGLRTPGIDPNGLSVYELTLDSDVVLEGEETPDAYTVIVTMNGRNQITLGQEIVPSRHVVTGPETRFRTRFEHPDILLLRVGKRLVADAMRERLGETPTSTLHFDPAVVETSGMGQWITLLHTFSETAASGLFDRSPLAAAHFEKLLLHGLLDTQPHSLSGDLAGERPRPKSAAVRRAMIHCEEHATDPVSIGELAMVAGVSVRALQLAFRTELGLTPMEYLRRVRLDYVHQDLLAIAQGRAEGTVTDVALRWGFTHLGRFSGFYRQTYGKLPSETARLTA
ncbi:helix-turn-helix transcriptional regulator [Amycolatopsis regifaucium]|uniref:AraC family transcriptional regulator n=1 Tax=Amycolatopsis regifaucium TaxID=546365 RepID=A0A154MPX3_9PSEU|nr:AraC family transcriptional regulator [Amycolatopsis regifaucium]KZB86368.1 AraC family transcriptional regulator [Amycolatopsis regifaucium]OKA06443.1 AraC family transcriptional regulator [Amycolatopsis regifaucium]SFJ27112.1 AraC-type DNA-binding protein [Amycolatopsis regifaucium]